MRPAQAVWVCVFVGWLYPMLQVLADSHILYECTDSKGGKQFTNVPANAIDCKKLELPVPSPRWTLIGKDKNTQTQVYIDRSSLSKVGGNWKVWSLFDYGGRSSISQSHFNCSNRTLVMVQQTDYSGAAGSGNVLHTFAISPEKARLQDVTPDSAGEFILDVACREAQVREVGPLPPKGKR